MELYKYVNQARENTGTDSDRKLCKFLGLNPTAVGNYRIGRSVPSEETMVVLARLAGVDPIEAMFDLKSWTAKEPARSIFEEIAKRLHATAAGVLFAAILAGTSSPSNAAVNGTGTDHQGGSQNINYAIYNVTG